VVVGAAASSCAASSSAPCGGRVETTTSYAARRPGASSHARRCTGIPSRRPASTARPARVAERTKTSTEAAPSRCAAATAAVAVPPPPRTAARGTAGTVPAASTAPTMPVTSVLWPSTVPSGRKSRVLTAPTAAPRTVSSSAHAAATDFRGIVTDSPRQAGSDRRASTNGGSCSSTRSWAS
jgi:hypothetical protein